MKIFNDITNLFAEEPDTGAKIIGRLGATGSGKTLYQTETNILPALLAGEEVWVSYWINWAGNNCHYFPPKDFEIISGLRNCLIVFDDIGRSFDARGWESENQEQRAFFELHRHRHNDIVFNTQDVSLVAKTVGIQAHEWSQIERVSDPILKRLWYSIIGKQGFTIRLDYLTFAELKKMANGWELGEDVAIDCDWHEHHFCKEDLVHRELNDFKIELFHKYCPKCMSRQGSQILKKDTESIVGFDNSKGIPVLKEEEYCPKHKEILLEIRESGLFDTDYEPEIVEKKVEWKAYSQQLKLLPFNGALSERQIKERGELNLNFN